jgi:hypothetical protein
VVSRPWLDYLKRSLFAKGELRHLIERDGLKGLTSTPSIFENVIGRGRLKFEPGGIGECGTSANAAAPNDCAGCRSRPSL